MSLPEKTTALAEVLKAHMGTFKIEDGKMVQYLLIAAITYEDGDQINCAMPALHAELYDMDTQNIGVPIKITESILQASKHQREVLKERLGLFRMADKLKIFPTKREAVH